MSADLPLTTGLFLNPRAAKATADLQTTAWQKFANEEPSLFVDAIGISTSGSTSGGLGSIVVLKKAAFEVSARAVNRRLKAGPRDVWGLALPLFHVGGYSIPIRAKLSDSRVVAFESSWSPRDFHTWLAGQAVTLLSLVPTQLYDLVESAQRAPLSLRAVVIGGGRLEESLHVKALALGWPVLQSFGMTECCSQIATAPLGSDGRELRLLDHVEVRTDENQKLWIRSGALLSARIVFDRVEGAAPIARLEKPVGADGWFETADRAMLNEDDEGGSLKVLGREGESVKVLGELVDLARVRTVIDETIESTSELAILKRRTWAIAIPDQRTEHELVLICEDVSATKDSCDLDGAHAQALRSAIEKLREILRLKLAPFEQPTRVGVVHELPRSSLGKVLSSSLTEQFTALKYVRKS